MSVVPLPAQKLHWDSGMMVSVTWLISLFSMIWVKIFLQCILGIFPSGCCITSCHLFSCRVPWSLGVLHLPARWTETGQSVALQSPPLHSCRCLPGYHWLLVLFQMLSVSGLWWFHPVMEGQVESHSPEAFRGLQLPPQIWMISLFIRMLKCSAQWASMSLLSVRGVLWSDADWCCSCALAQHRDHKRMLSCHGHLQQPVGLLTSSPTTSFSSGAAYSGQAIGFDGICLSSSDTFCLLDVPGVSCEVCQNAYRYLGHFHQASLCDSATQSLRSQLLWCRQSPWSCAISLLHQSFQMEGLYWRPLAASAAECLW